MRRAATPNRISGPAVTTPSDTNSRSRPRPPWPNAASPRACSTTSAVSATGSSTSVSVANDASAPTGTAFFRKL